jgi:hypothetical protein
MLWPASSCALRRDIKVNRTTPMSLLRGTRLVWRLGMLIVVILLRDCDLLFFWLEWKLCLLLCGDVIEGGTIYHDLLEIRKINCICFICDAIY